MGMAGSEEVMIKYKVSLGWYKVSLGWQMISPVEIEKETESSVWINGCRRAKISTYENYFDSWDDAKQFLMDHAQKRVDSLRLQLERANGELGNIKGLKPTTE